MANTISLTGKYMPAIGELYKFESRTSILDAPEELALPTSDARTVMLPRISMQGLAHYKRDTGFKRSDLGLTWDLHTFTQDRGRDFLVDNMDDIETVGVAFGRLCGEFVKAHVAPELDAYRFSTYAAKAGSSAAGTVSATNVVTAIDDAVQAMDDAEVPIEGRVLYLSVDAYKALKNNDKVARRFEITPEAGTFDRNLTLFDGMQVVRVPKSRFYTAYTFNDGSTAGQTDGGFVPAAGAKGIHFMIIAPSAVLQIVKHGQTRVFAPNRAAAARVAEAQGVTQEADAWKFDYRVYHDAFVYGDKTKGIYVYKES